MMLPHEGSPTLHLCKLAVGAQSVETLRAWQAERLRTDPPLRHRTRNFPRRAGELLGGGSIYWVVAGMMAARQLLLDIAEERGQDGVTRAVLILDPTLHPVRFRAMKPFQGWRYLNPAAAPADLDDSGGPDARLPPALQRDLQALCLL